MYSTRMVSLAVMAAALSLGMAGSASAQAAAQTGARVETGFQKPAKEGDRVAAGYVAPRLKIGQPDLSGVWSNASNTRMTRPANFKTLTLTDEEQKKAQASNPSNIRQATDDNQKLSDGKLDGKDLAQGRGYNSFWIDPGSNYANVKGTWRTSWIVDPPSGQVPISDDGRRLLASMRGARGRGTGYDNPEERGAGERCIVGFGGTGGPPLMNVLYNNNYQIIQSPDAVVIVTEMVHDARIIRLNADHKPPVMNQYLGDSIGWWEGDTLVVETTGINPNGGSQVQLSPGGKIIERFTRYSDNQVLYEFEVIDPAIYSQVWKGEVGLNKVNGNVFEYACHEGNYGLPDILKGGRENDRNGKSNARGGDRDEG
ncbi:MAG TPA: hypothetical protein VG942_09260 [Hyphomonadaceae bacterium]|nr:hypothetical protein [Hyphomonadaceae bacterium]